MRIKAPSGKPLARVQVTLGPEDQEAVRLLREQLRRFDGSPNSQTILGFYASEAPDSSRVARFLKRLIKRW